MHSIFEGQVRRAANQNYELGSPPIIGLAPPIANLLAAKLHQSGYVWARRMTNVAIFRTN